MEVFMNGLAQFVAVMNKILWDYLLLFLLVFTGVSSPCVCVSCRCGISRRDLRRCSAAFP